MAPRINAHLQRGMTIIEVLISVALLSVIILVVLTPLTGFFGLTRRSNQQVSATQAVQRAVNDIRGDWLVQANYDQVCVTSSQALDATIRVQITNLDPTGQALNSLTGVQNCASSTVTSTAPLRRVEVQKLGSDRQVLASLTTEVARP